MSTPWSKASSSAASSSCTFSALRSKRSMWLMASTRAPWPSCTPSTTWSLPVSTASRLTRASAAAPNSGSCMTRATTSSRPTSCGETTASAVPGAPSVVASARGGAAGRSATSWARSSHSFRPARSRAAICSSASVGPSAATMRTAATTSPLACGAWAWPCASARGASSASSVAVCVASRLSAGALVPSTCQGAPARPRSSSTPRARHSSVMHTARRFQKAASCGAPRRARRLSSTCCASIGVAASGCSLLIAPPPGPGMRQPATLHAAVQSAAGS